MCSENNEKKTCGCRVVPPGTWGSFQVHTCGKPAKGTLADGSPACGIHLRQEQKSIESRQKMQKEMDEWDRKKRVCEEISETHNLTTLHTYTNKFHPDEAYCTISLAELQGILAKIK